MNTRVIPIVTIALVAVTLYSERGRLFAATTDRSSVAVRVAKEALMAGFQKHGMSEADTYNVEAQAAGTEQDGTIYVTGHYCRRATGASPAIASFEADVAVDGDSGHVVAMETMGQPFMLD